MYQEEDEKKSFSLIKFLLILILIIVFVLLLVWLLPIPKMDGINNRIFNANIQEMKNAAIPYFTTDKLPEKEGDSVTLTLQEMLDMKLLLPFTDKNGDSCDTEKSYVTLTKMKDYYELKVNLKCNEEEDYILVTLGCYSYCTSAICEKDPEEPKKPDPVKPDPVKPDPVKPDPVKPDPTPAGPSCTLYVANGSSSNGWYTSNVEVKFKSKTSGSTITAYGIGTSLTYANNNSYTVSADGTTTVYGYVKDSKGKTATCSIVVKKDTNKPSCELSVLQGTKSQDGTYNSDIVIGFKSKTDATSGISAFGLSNNSQVVYNSTTQTKVTSNGTYTIYGFVKDNAGHTNSCNITVTRKVVPTPTPDSKPSCELVITKGTLGNNGWYTSNVEIGFKSKQSTNGAKITSFGIGKEETYGNSTYTIQNDGTQVIFGYVKDSNGKTASCSIQVKRDATKPTCVLKVTKGTKNSTGNYTSDIEIGFDSKKDNMSGINSFGIGKSKDYSNNTSYKITAVGDHTVYGYVKDNAGNENTCSIKVSKQANIEYQYSKNIARQYSAWSNWTTLTYDPANKPAFGNYELIEIVDLGKKQEIAYYNKQYGDVFYKNEIIKVGTVNQRVCEGYTYYRHTSTETVTYIVNNNSQWVYQGTITTTSVPTDTLAVKYEFVGFDWQDCTTCTVAPRKIWKKWTRQVQTVQTSQISTSTITTQCKKFVDKPVEIFASAKVAQGYEEIKVPVYRDVYSYKKRTRTVEKEAYTDYKWSFYNDTTLTNQGYKMTGKTRVVN